MSEEQKPEFKSLMWANFKPVPFVCASQLESSSVQLQKYPELPLLDGKEVREFYQQLIATPSDVRSDNSKGQSVTQENKKSTKHSKKINSMTVKKKNHNTNTIFKHAQEGNVKGIAECLSSEQNINIIDMYGWTPLMCAACSGSLPVVEYLLNHGADVNIADNQGRQALDLAQKMRHYEVIKLLKTPYKSTLPPVKRKSSNFCNVCNISYKETNLKHNSSIIHQLNSGPKKQSTFYHIQENNVGFQLMLKEGWDKNQGLGPLGSGCKFPVKTVLKRDRQCLGNKTDAKPRITHFNPFDISAVKRVQHQQIPVVRQRTLKKWERQKQQMKSKRAEINFRREFYEL